MTSKHFLSGLGIDNITGLFDQITPFLYKKSIFDPRPENCLAIV